MSARRGALNAARALAPMEVSLDDKVWDLRCERRLLSQYLTTSGQRMLRRRIDEIDAAIAKLRQEKREP